MFDRSAILYLRVFRLVFLVAFPMGTDSSLLLFARVTGGLLVAYFRSWESYPHTES